MEKAIEEKTLYATIIKNLQSDLGLNEDINNQGIE